MVPPAASVDVSGLLRASYVVEVVRPSGSVVEVRLPEASWVKVVVLPRASVVANSCPEEYSHLGCVGLGLAPGHAHSASGLASRPMRRQRLSGL